MLLFRATVRQVSSSLFFFVNYIYICVCSVGVATIIIYVRFVGAATVYCIYIHTCSVGIASV